MTNPELHGGCAELSRVVLCPLDSLLFLFDADAAVAGMTQAPFDPDRAGTDADIPEQFAGFRCESRQRQCADFRLRELPVILEPCVGKTRRKGDDPASVAATISMATVLSGSIPAISKSAAALLRMVARGRPWLRAR